MPPMALIIFSQNLVFLFYLPSTWWYHHFPKHWTQPLFFFRISIYFSYILFFPRGQRGRRRSQMNSSCPPYQATFISFLKDKKRGIDQGKRASLGKGQGLVCVWGGRLWVFSCWFLRLQTLLGVFGGKIRIPIEASVHWWLRKLDSRISKGFLCSGALLLYFKSQCRTMDIKKEHRRGNSSCYSLYDIGQIMAPNWTCTWTGSEEQVTN